jgi:hypothetical protein
VAFTVRSTTSGHNGITKYLVHDGPRRVSARLRDQEGAQANADRLNIGAMVKDHAEDPCPYQEKLAEDRAEFRKQQDDASRCPGCGVSFNGLRGHPPVPALQHWRLPPRRDPLTSNQGIPPDQNRSP